MTKRDWAVLACKILALWILFQATFWLSNLVLMLGAVIYRLVKEGHSGDWDIGILFTGLFPVIIGGIGWLLWAKARPIARRIFPEDDSPFGDDARAADLLAVGLICVGVFVLIWGVVESLEALAWRMQQPFRELWKTANWHVKLWSGLARTLIGLWLIFGNRGVVQLLKRFRTVGIRPVTDEALATDMQRAADDEGSSDW